MTLPARPAYARKRPAPRGQGLPKLMRSDDITWTRILDGKTTPRERYRIVYIDNEAQRSERLIELQKLGEVKGVPYLGVMHAGKFKTLRADRVVEVLEQITTGHPPSIKPWRQLDYSVQLPPFPLDNALYKVGTIASSNRTWTVDLNRYTCTCPEQRIRRGFGYTPGQLGFVCPHVAKAILEHLPAHLQSTISWPEELVSFLRDPRRVHIDNLT
jgi:hypothetical protein